MSNNYLQEGILNINKNITSNGNNLLMNLGESERYMRNRRQKGFTLLEILLILFLMMAVLGSVGQRFSSTENFVQTKADSANRVRIKGAVELYKLDTGRLPEKIEDLYLPSSGIEGWRGPYLAQGIVKPTRDREPYQLDEKGNVIP